MAISDKDLRELAKIISDSAETNRNALESVATGLSDLIVLLKPQGNKSKKGGGDSSGDNSNSGGNETTLSNETIAKLSDALSTNIGKAVGEHISRNSGISGGGSGGDDEAGGGGGGGGGGRRRSGPEARLLAQNQSAITGDIKNLKKMIYYSLATVQKTTSEYIIGRLEDTVRQLVNTMTDFASGKMALDGISNRFEQTADSLSRNLGGFVESFVHDMTLTRLSFGETMRSITSDLSNGGRAFAIYGGTVQEYSNDLQALRRNINSDGTNMFRTMQLDEQNDYLNRMYQTMVAQGITDRLNSEQVQNYARNQYLALADIQNLTGLSLKELQDMNRDNQNVIDELVARGMFTEEQGEQLTEATTAITAVMPEELRSLFNQGLAQGIAPAAIAFQGNDAALMAELGTAIDAMENAVASGMTADQARSIFLDTINWEALHGTSLTTIEGTLQSSLNSLRAAEERRAAQENSFISVIRNQIDSLKNTHSIIGVLIETASGIVGLIGTTGALVAAIAANIVALRRNTMALALSANRPGNYGGGLLGRLLGVPRGLSLFRTLLSTFVRFSLVFGGLVSIGTDLVNLFQNWGNIDIHERIGSMVATGVKALFVGLGVALMAATSPIWATVGAIAALAASVWFAVDMFTGGWLTEKVQNIFTSISRAVRDWATSIDWNQFLMSTFISPWAMLISDTFALLPDAMKRWLYDLPIIGPILRRTGDLLGMDGAEQETQRVIHQVEQDTESLSASLREFRTASANRETASLDRDVVETAYTGAENRRRRVDENVSRELRNQTRLLTELLPEAQRTSRNTGRTDVVYDTGALGATT